MHITLKADATDEELRNFAWLWATLLSEEDYTRAFNQLLHRAGYPGWSWCGSADDLRKWIEGYGTDDLDPAEAPARVTCPVTAEGEQPRQDVLREMPVYPDFVARLDFWLPVDGEWSDLMASFDFVRVGHEIAPVLVALRVP